MFSCNVVDGANTGNVFVSIVLKYTVTVSEVFFNHLPAAADLKVASPPVAFPVLPSSSVTSTSTLYFVFNSVSSEVPGKPAPTIVVRKAPF